MKVGISSQNFRTITGHAGKARRFFVYEVDAQRQIVPQEKLDLPKEMSMHEWHGEGPHPLFDLDVLITASCGEGFKHRMSKAGITVHVTDEIDPLQAVSQLVSVQ